MRSQLGTPPMNFPLEEAPAVLESFSKAEQIQQPSKEQLPDIQDPARPADQIANMPTPLQTPTITSEAPSEMGSTDPTTPSPAVTPQPVKSLPTSTRQPRGNKIVVPVIPAVPILPLSPKVSRQHRDSVSVISSTSPAAQVEQGLEEERRPSTTSVPTSDQTSPNASADTLKPASPPAPQKSWADVMRSNTVPKPTKTAVTTSQIANGLGPAKNETLSDVLNTMDVTASHSAAKIAFLKPRGLVNTGNMCYMNSVCLLFCCCDPPKLIDAGVTNLGLLYSIL
jgi:ubiquitin carboxyl-terminal hydrolase 10